MAELHPQLIDQDLLHIFSRSSNSTFFSCTTQPVSPTTLFFTIFQPHLEYHFPPKQQHWQRGCRRHRWSCNQIVFRPARLACRQPAGAHSGCGGSAPDDWLEEAGFCRHAALDWAIVKFFCPFALDDAAPMLPCWNTRT